MTLPVRQFSLLVSKDLRIEARGRQTLGLVIVLGLLVITVLGMGLGTGGTFAGFGATAVLWVAYLFSGVLCFEKTMAIERNDGVMAALLMGLIFLSSGSGHDEAVERHDRHEDSAVWRDE